MKCFGKYHDGTSCYLCHCEDECKVETEKIENEHLEDMEIDSDIF